MSVQREKLIEELRASKSYEDIIALALARSRQTRFSADTHQWCEVLFELGQRYSEQIPELKSLRFSERPPLPPQTDQVYELFTFLARAREASFPNPQFKFLLVSEEEKTRISQAIGDSLKRYDPMMDDVVRILEEKLAVG